MTTKKVGRPKKEKEFDKFIETYEGMDKRRGRPIRINYQELEVRNGVAEVIFFGDLHWGSPQCDVDRAKDMLNWALKNKVYVMCMGDMLESATRDSVGAGVYEQTHNPQKQMEEVIELFRPLAKAGLIIGWHSGN